MDDLDLARLQFRVRTGLNLERNLSSPGDLRGCLGWLGADLDDLINRLLGDLLLDGGLAIRLRVGDLLGDRDGLLTRLALGDSLRGTCRHARVKLDLHAERNLSLNCLGGLTCGLGANTDDCILLLCDRRSSHNRVAGRLTVDKLLRRGELLHPDDTLGIDDLFANRQSVIRNNLRLKRDLAFGRRHKVLVLKTRTVFDDLLDRLLVILSINDIGLVTDRAELRGELTLTVLALLHNLGLTRCKGRVRTHLRAVRNRYRPRDILAVLSRLDADLHYLVNSRLRGFPRAVAKLLLRTSLALSHDL